MKSDKIWEIMFVIGSRARQETRRQRFSSRLAQPSRRIDFVYPRGSPSHLVRALGRGRVFELVFSKQVQGRIVRTGVSICVTRWTSERRWASCIKFMSLPISHLVQWKRSSSRRLLSKLTSGRWYNRWRILQKID